METTSESWTEQNTWNNWLWGWPTSAGTSVTQPLQLRLIWDIYTAISKEGQVKKRKIQCLWKEGCLRRVLHGVYTTDSLTVSSTCIPLISETIFFWIWSSGKIFLGVLIIQASRNPTIKVRIFPDWFSPGKYKSSPGKHGCRTNAFLVLLRWVFKTFRQTQNTFLCCLLKCIHLQMQSSNAIITLSITF